MEQQQQHHDDNFATTFAQVASLLERQQNSLAATSQHLFEIKKNYADTTQKLEENVESVQQLTAALLQKNQETKTIQATDAASTQQQADLTSLSSSLIRERAKMLEQGERHGHELRQQRAVQEEREKENIQLKSKLKELERQIQNDRLITSGLVGVSFVVLLSCLCLFLLSCLSVVTHR